MDKKNHGFTLVEMAVVVGVIALIIAGIFVSQSLLRGAETRAVVGEYTAYVQAISNFRDKYQALPGDFATASSIWSSATNGDGSGHITENTSNTRLDEQFVAWTHLSNAEMIKGSFTGVAGANGSRDRVPGTNIPQSQLANAGWGLISVTLGDIASGYNHIYYTAPDIPPNHLLWIGGRSLTGTNDLQGYVLTPAEALSIDSKSDDGIPSTGKIVSQTDSGSCLSSSTSYLASSSDIKCSLVFKTGF